MTTPSRQRRIAILGSTGSIGTQALDVIANQSEHLAVEVLTARSNATLLIQQALKFKPNAVVIGDESLYQTVADALWPEGIKTYFTQGGLSYFDLEKAKNEPWNPYWTNDFSDFMSV